MNIQNKRLPNNLNKEWFFELFDNSSIAMALTDISSSKFHAVNKTFRTYTGYKINEEIDKCALGINLVAPKNRDNYKMLLERKGYINNLESVVKKKNGEIFWSLTSIQIIVLENSKFLLTSLFDITYQKETEGHIGHLHAITQSSKDAIISESLDGNIKSWNKGAVEMFGYSPKQAIGKPCSIIIPANYLKEENEILEHIIKNKIANQFDTVRAKKNGDQFYVSLTISPQKDKSGNIIAISKIVRDITTII